MEKDIIKILSSYLKYWYLFLIGIVISLLLAFLYVRYEVTPEYYASGKILLNDKEEGGAEAGLQSFSDMGLIKNSRNIQDEIGVLQSYDLMEQTMYELGFNVGYFAEGRFSEIEIYEKDLPFKVVLSDSISPKQYGVLGAIVIVDEFSYIIETTNDDDTIKKSTHNFNEKVNSVFGEFHLELTSNNLDLQTQQRVLIVFRNIKELAINYNFKMSIYNVSDEGGGLLELSLTDAIPQRGVDIINTLIEVYAENSAISKNFLAESTLKLIDERLELLTNDLNLAEKDVETYKKSNDLTDVDSDAARFVVLADEIDRELDILRTEINSLNSLERNLIQSSGNSFSSITLVNIQNAALVNLILTYNTEVQRRKNVVSASGTGNPMLPEIDRQLSESKNLILENVRSIKAQLTRSQRDLINKSSQYRTKISSVPSAERALLEINRDQGIKQSLYLYLLQKREEEALSISVPFSDIRIIETPKSTNYPVTGGKTPIYLGAIIFGVLIPFLWVFVKEKFNNKVLDQKDITEATNKSILGKLASNKGKEVLVVTQDNVNPVAELFRLMRHNLKFLSQGKPNQVIMVTSGKQGEGKTFVSINLAATLAITGKKVVVVGCDLRAPKLMKDMQLSYNLGLSDYIVDHKLNVSDILTTYDKEENLFFIGAGPIPPNPGELILAQRVKGLINELKSLYDYIILDCPPIGKVADAFSLATVADSTLFVVRYNYTEKAELNLINEISKNNTDLSSLMIVFNDVKIDKSGATSYGYGIKQ